MSVIAESFMALKSTMFVLVKQAKRELVSVAPKNNTPTMVVAQSMFPIKIMVAANKTSFLTMIMLFCFSVSDKRIVKGSVMYSQ